jgi:hypothetical protein
VEEANAQETRKVLKNFMVAPETNALIVSHSSPQAIVPAGHLKIARRFNVG